MKTSPRLAVRTCSLILCLLVLTFVYEQNSFARQQQLAVKPTHLYKFRIRNDYLGYLLTPYYSEGLYHGYTYEEVIGSIYVPPPGYVPDPSAGLVPLHQWTVIQNGRAYTAYDHIYSTHGGNYHYDGIRGYIYHPGLTSITSTFDPNNPQEVYLSKFTRRYSQTYGFWYGHAVPFRTDVNPILYSFSQPPTSSFDSVAIIGGYFPTVCGTSPSLPSSSQVPESAPWQGCLTGVLVPGITFTAPPPPPPPPACDLTQEQSCYNNGGIWNSTNCTCNTFQPDPCLEGGAEDPVIQKDAQPQSGIQRPPCLYTAPAPPQ